ncbi:hypothetical protein FBY14_12450 [Azospirillum brasilense]|nr:hypothetical protein FBY14_12450 [Azospirillum brasilense]
MTDADADAFAQSLSDEELASYKVRMIDSRNGEAHTAEERAVIVERIQRQDARDEQALAERGFPINGRVRIAETYRRMMNHGHWVGRQGTIVRSALGGDCLYVRLDPAPRERVVKVPLIDVADLEPAPQFGHNGGPPLDDAAPAAPAIRITPPSNVSMKEIALKLPATSDVRACASSAGFTITRFVEGRSWSTLAYVSGAQSDDEALSAFHARVEACRVDAQLPRVQVSIGPRHRGAYAVSITIDGTVRSGTLPFAGHRGYAGSKRSAEAFGRDQRRAAAAALIAHEAEHGPWQAKMDADERAKWTEPTEADRRSHIAALIRIALAKPWNGKGMPTPSQFIRKFDIEDEAAAQAAPRSRPHRRVLVLPCSATKRRDRAPLPARDRYTGPLWLSYRAAVAEIGAAPRTLVLSAEFGLIDADTPIPHYERRLDDDRAVDIAADPAQLDRLAAAIGAATEVYVTGGALYRATVTAMVKALRITGRVPPDLALIAPDGLGIGEQRAALRAWLAAAAPARAAAVLTPGQGYEAQRRCAQGVQWQPCEVMAVAGSGCTVRFHDGAQLPRPAAAVRRAV